ncbi:MAG: DCC1-like thiol-disulfide oxidoreductase family protein [Longimicrobiales bacterium]
MRAGAPAPVLLYDGLCGFCDGAVRFVLAHDRRGVLRFAPLQGAFAAGVVERHPEIADVDSLVVVEPGSDTESERVRVRSDAALAVARQMGGPWRALSVFRAVPRLVRDVVYDGIARNRYRWFERRDACRVPDPSVRERFVD